MPRPGDVAECSRCHVEITWWESPHSGYWVAVQRQDSAPGECPQTEQMRGRYDGHMPRPPRPETPAPRAEDPH